MNPLPEINWPDIHRILIVGVTGSGKTTLARQLAERTGLPRTELDVLHWGPNWEKRPEFEEEAQAAVAQVQWVLEGGYKRVTPEAWPRSDLVVWLDYSLLTVLRRLIIRIFRRRLRNEALYSGNRESLRTHFFSRQSLILWLFQTYRPRKELHAKLSEHHPYVSMVHFRRPSETEHWLNNQAI